MDYRVKTIIGGIEMLETADTVIRQEDDVTYQPPSISAIKLLDNATIGTMEIGSTPSDCLTFTINNPNKPNYDGETVELWIAPPEDDTAAMEEMTEIEDAVGDDASDEGMDDSESDELEDEDDSEGEDPTEEDLSDAEETTAANIESMYTAFEGETVETEDEDTDEAEEPEWIRIGTYYVQSQTNADDNSAVTLTCYDSMQKLNRRFFASNSTTTVQAMFDDLRAQALDNLEVVIDAFDYDDDASRIITMPSPVTYREVLGWFAGLIGGFATCDDDGSIGFALYSFNDGLYLDSTLNYINVDSSGEMELDGIECDTGFIQESKITAGFEADLSFKNPFMTQEILESILESYKGIRFSGGALNMTWDSSIDAGSFIRIMTPDEYTNYLQLQNALEEDGLTDEEILDIKQNMNGLGTVLIVSYQLIDFTGDTTTTIASICNSVTANENQMTSPTDAKFNRVTAKIVETEQLIAQKADIEDLQAAQADINHLKVGDLTIGGVTVNIYDLALAIKQSSVATETTWYKAADSVPAAPTVRDPSSAGWSTIEPVYGSNRSKHLYSCMCVTYADDTPEDPHFVWGDVHLIQSWEAAKDAYNYADAAEAHAAEAKASAANASEYATRALGNLSTVQNVTETLNWITAHGTMALTSDTALDPSHVYFVRDNNGDYHVGNYYYSLVTEPNVNDIATYYELTIDESLNNYVGTHLALTDYGLNLIFDNSSYRIHIGTLNASGDEGVYILDENGNPVSFFGESINFSSDRAQYIGNENAYIIFNPENNGSITIGGSNIQLGSDKKLSEVLAELNGTLIFDTTYEWNTGHTVATLTAHVYRGGVDIAQTEFDPQDFTWYLKSEDGEVPIIPSGRQDNTGYTTMVNISDCGYGAEVVAKFTPPEYATALTNGGDALTDSDGDALEVRASGDSVRVRDLTVSTTLYPTDKAMIIGAEDEHLVTMQTLQDYLAPVSGVKGEEEQEYRTGDVSISQENIGVLVLSNLDIEGLLN